MHQLFHRKTHRPQSPCSLSAPTNLKLSITCTMHQLATRKSDILINHAINYNILTPIDSIKHRLESQTHMLLATQFILLVQVTFMPILASLPSHVRIKYIYILESASNQIQKLPNTRIIIIILKYISSIWFDKDR